MGKHFSALISMIFGSALVFLTVVMINRYSQLIQDEASQKVTNIEVKKKPKPPAQKKVRKPKPKPKPRVNTAPAPITSLGSALSGIDFGLPGFDADELSQFGGDLLGDNQNVVMTDDSVDEPPKAVSRAAIPYPPGARARGIEGYVVLSLLIAPNGKIEKVKVLEAQPSGIFDSVAETGIMNWKFQPAVYQGIPVKVWAKQKIRFDLS